MEDEQMAVKNNDYFITETTIDPALPIPVVVAHLVKRKVVGKLIFDLTQGTVQKVSLVERTRAKDGQREKVREILGV
jgi:hypothetical protein